MAYIKDFLNWNQEKIKIDARVEDLKEDENTHEIKDVIRKWEIRWCALGVNVGSEIDGKGKEFLRPCLLLEQASPDIFLVIPMSTKIKSALGYRKIIVEGREVSLCIHNLKTISRKRIYGRISKLSVNKIIEIRSWVRKYFNL